MDVFRIPLTPRQQTFQITLRAVTYTWQLYWLVPARCWVVNIADVTGKPIINGVPLLPGSDLLGQFGYLGPGGMLFVHTDHTSVHEAEAPSVTHLGITGHLFWANV